MIGTKSLIMLLGEEETTKGFSGLFNLENLKKWWWLILLIIIIIWRLSKDDKRRTN